MRKRKTLIALQIAFIVSAVALLLTKELDNPIALYSNYGIIALIVILYFHLGRCPYCKKHNRHAFLLKKATYCHNCGELIEFE